ncbi:oxoglutarate-dependent flavonoid 7-O-demethylase 1 isoform X2 [Aristolochia californica]|uniref:oxoglutarate-dependent flavonoid 7-O-demethylase 1 isoform X2 n=1 Tax=Aristolochia californica TaxID=171875 RepID=UPI0035E2EF8D
MELSELSLGSSLPVPSVQEMVKEPIATVPHRYIRPDQEPPARLKGTSVSLIPIIDMQKLHCGEFMAEELERLHWASKEWGFFQLINHGVGSSLIEKMKFEVQSFFQLPLAEKQKFAQLPGDVQGYGQAFVVSEEQKLDWGDMFSLTLESYANETQKLSMIVLEQMARPLGMEPKEMTDLFEDGLQGTRMSYYPPCPQPEQVIGFSPHSDFMGLTVLQVNEVQGLEVRKEGKWVPVEPLPDAFIVNIGDQLEIISNGTYESVEHRATVNSAQERLSIGTFYCPKPEAEIGPAASLVNPGKPALFKTILVADYVKAPYSAEIQGKALINSTKIAG